MVKAKVLAPINHLGRNYAKGDSIEVDHGTAHQLVAAGVIAVVPETPAAPAAAAKPSIVMPASKGRVS